MINGKEWLTIENDTSSAWTCTGACCYLLPYCSRFYSPSLISNQYRWGQLWITVDCCDRGYPYLRKYPLEWNCWFFSLWPTSLQMDQQGHGMRSSYDGSGASHWHLVCPLDRRDDPKRTALPSNPTFVRGRMLGAEINPWFKSPW